MDVVRSRTARSLAAWLAGLLSSLLALAAHLAAGGPVPSLMILVALMALLGMAAVIVSRFQLPAWALLIACALAQQALHLGFPLFSGGTGTGPAGHGHGDLPLEPPAVAGAAVPVGYSLHLMLHLHMAAALLAYAAVAYHRGRAGPAHRFLVGSGKSSAKAR